MAAYDRLKQGALLKLISVAALWRSVLDALLKLISVAALWRNAATPPPHIFCLSERKGGPKPLLQKCDVALTLHH